MQLVGWEILIVQTFLQLAESFEQFCVSFSQAVKVKISIQFSSRNL